MNLRSFLLICVVSLIGSKTLAAVDQPLVVAVLSERSAQSRASRLADLVEAQLTSKPGIRLVERREIDAVLREHQLDAAFAPDAVAQRVTLAHLLKADLLIVLRDQTQPYPYVRAVISESKQGLRIANRGIGGNENPDVDVPAVESLVAAAREKYGQRIDEVCAVPPFLGLDLTRRYDPLLAPYARIVEQNLLARPGVLVVELAEARALALELAIGGGKITRPAPLYFTGSCRNDGTGADRRVRITLTISRGEKEVAKLDSGAIAPQDVAAFLRSAPDKALKHNASTRPAPPEDEAKILANREREYISLGQWQDAIAVAQASLLLSPHQPRVDRDIAFTVSEIRRRRSFLHSRRADPSLAQISDEEMVALYRLGLEHYRSYLRATRVSYHDEFVLAREFLWLFQPDGFAEATLEDRRRELLGVLSDKAADRAPPDDTTLLLRERIPWLSPSEPLQAGFDRKLTVFRECASVFPDAKAMTSLFNLPEKPFSDDTPQRRAAVRALAAIDLPICREAAAILQRRIDLGLPSRYDKAPPTTATAPAATEPALSQSDVRFTPLALRWLDETGAEMKPPTKFTTWISLDQHNDAAKSDEGIWLIGVDRVAHRIAKAGVTEGLCWDGKYLWTLGPANDPCIQVIDPHAGVVGRITTTQGLPPIAAAGGGDGVTEFLCAAIAPGKICCAGFFDRMWIAVADFDKGAAHLKVIFEATHTAGDGDDAWHDPKIATRLGYMLSLGDAGASRRILLGRAEMRGVSIHAHPLLIDPTTARVDVVQAAVNVHPNNPRIILHDGAAWWIDYHPRVVHPNVLCRLGANDQTPRRFEPSLPDGHLAFFEGRVHLLPDHNKEWFVATDPAGPFQKVSADIPAEIQFRTHLYTSNPFGLLLIPDNRIADGKIYQVTFPTLTAPSPHPR